MAIADLFGLKAVRLFIFLIFGQTSSPDRPFVFDLDFGTLLGACSTTNHEQTSNEDEQ